MAKFEIKDYYSTNIDHIWDWIPSGDVQSIYFILDVYIGEKDSEGSSIYSFIVTTPEALLAKMKEKKDFIEWGRPYLIIKNYSFENVEYAVYELINRYLGKTNDPLDMYKRLNREMWWEYEDCVIEK